MTNTYNITRIFSIGRIFRFKRHRGYDDGQNFIVDSIDYDRKLVVFRSDLFVGLSINSYLAHLTFAEAFELYSRGNMFTVFDSCGGK